MSDPSRVEDVFLAALEKGTAEERNAYLDDACKGEPELRRLVERLLEAHPKAGGFLEPPARPAAESTASHVPASDLLGTVIAGRYKLLEQIGEGGMGTVWVAEQTQPVRRKVALKLIKAGMDSKTVLARFEAERQALALMDHPNIAKVLDGGVTEQGRPFFVMEYVKGVPLTRYSDDVRLTVAERLGLFIPVCHAVQHAHQKGIIHRDLKPSNVLVCLYDSKPVPKVIDFGLAKAIHQPLTERTLHTAHGVMMGTPLYMSPEQAELNNLDVDTRTDVYSLGVILYELLIGTTPLERQRFKEAAWQEMLRLIKEEEPQRPSTRLSSSATAPSVAAQRQTEPVKLSRLLKGELDWIVMKALEKERGRRYESASAFALDVQRYLMGESVSAVPPSAGYRLRKFVRRNKRSVVAGALLFVVLLLGVIGTSIGLVLADAARRRAVAAEQNERDERQKADAARRAAERTAASLQVDVDLAEVRFDSEIGLLRLARTLKTLPADEKDLREFVTAAILATGQTYAPLMPRINHDGHDVLHHELSADARTLLTSGDDGTARLWDTRSARLIAVLRRDNEPVLACKFSPDGKTAITDSKDGVLRFWNVPAGTFRAETEPRPERWGAPRRGVIRVAENRVLTAAENQKEMKGPPPREWWWVGPVELWEMTTGRRIARLDRPDLVDDRQFQFLGEGRWLTTIARGNTVIVLSADDGREIGRLSHSHLRPEERIVQVLSPNERRVVTTEMWPGYAGTGLSVWESDTWRRLPTPHLPRFYTDEVRVWDLGDDRLLIWADHQWLVCRPGTSEPAPFISTTWGDLIDVRGDLLHDGEGTLHNLRTGHRHFPPATRRYHPDLARFAPGGRFLGNIEDDNVSVIDTLTDKRLETDGYSDHDWNEGDRQPLAHLLGTGLCGVVNGGSAGTDRWVLLLPTAVPALPPDWLELWAQVVARGELKSGGEWLKWDEPTWERKRQELAARAAPVTGFPFPGHVAHDRLYWLRREFNDSRHEHWVRIGEELLRRAEAAGDKAEVVRWRTTLEKLR